LIDDPGVDDSLIPAVCGQQGDLGTMVALQQQLGDFEIKFKRSVVDTTQAFVKQLKFDLSQLKSKPNVHAQALVTVGHPASTATISLSSMASSTPMARFTLTPRRPPRTAPSASCINRWATARARRRPRSRCRSRFHMKPNSQTGIADRGLRCRLLRASVGP
jgi:hypothetical protein